MTDVLMLVIVAAFFALAGGLVVGCDRILGHEDASGEGDGLVDASEDDGASEIARGLRGVV